MNKELARALIIARNFHVRDPHPTTSNQAYTRGQTELIRGLFGMPLDSKDNIRRFITHLSDHLSVELTVDEITAAAGGEG